VFSAALSIAATLGVAGWLVVYFFFDDEEPDASADLGGERCLSDLCVGETELLYLSFLVLALVCGVVFDRILARDEERDAE